jgi:hypothetical protein
MAKAKATLTEELDDDVELADEGEDVEEDGASSSKQEVTFGVSDLCKHLTKKTGKTIKPRDLRTLIRKMAREDNPRVDREITAGNRTRYDWPDGLKDPEVKAIIKAVTSGELEAQKKEALDALKNRKKDKTKKGKKSKKVVEVEEDDDVEEVGDDDFEDDEE